MEKRKKSPYVAFRFRQEVDTEVSLSLDAILVERDRLLKEVNTINEQEKAAIEQLRQTLLKIFYRCKQPGRTKKRYFSNKPMMKGFKLVMKKGITKSLSDMAASISTANETTELSL